MAIVIPSGNTGGPKRIYIVDKSPRHCFELVQIALASGCAATGAYSTTVLLSKLHTFKPPDVLILGDLSTNRLQFLTDFLQAVSVRPYVVSLTAEPYNRIQEIRMREYGVDTVLHKPVDPEAFNELLINPLYSARPKYQLPAEPV